MQILIPDDLDIDMWLFLLPDMDREREIHYVIVESVLASNRSHKKPLELMSSAPFAVRIIPKLFIETIRSNQQVNIAEFVVLSLWPNEVGYKRIKKFYLMCKKIGELAEVTELFIALTEGGVREISLTDIMDKEDYERLRKQISNSYGKKNRP